MFTAPLDTILIFAATTPFIDWMFSRINFRRASGFYAAAGLGIAGYYLYRLFLEVSKNPVTVPIEALPFQSHLRIDFLGIFMAFTFIIIGLLVTVYSIKFVDRDADAPLYYTLLLLMIAGMVGVVFAGDFFTLFIFWELMCLTSYVLVVFRRGVEPAEAGMKYLIMSSAGSATVLFSLSILYGLTGTLNFTALTVSADSIRNSWGYISWMLILAGFGIKAAIVPLHTWLPDAYTAAPSPISSILSAVVTETGIYALSRAFFTAFIPLRIEWSLILAFLSVVTMTFGNLSALLQNDLKRLLAYSSIGHIGYMLVGLSIGTELGLAGTTLHLFNHALMKGAAFLCVGAIIYNVGKRRLGEVAGVGRRMPVTVAAFAVSLFALTGMPPLNGFISELVLFTSSVQADMAWLGIAIIINSILSAAYVLRILRSLLRADGDGRWRNVKEAPLTMLLPICLMATLIILFGIWPDPVLDLAKRAADALLYGYLGGG